MSRTKPVRVGDRVTIRVGKEQREYTLGPDVDLDAEDVRDAQGRRIDQAYVDRVVDEARRGGRPALVPGAGEAPVMHLRLPADVSAELDVLAAEAGRTRSEVAREAITRYVRRRRRRTT